MQRLNGIEQANFLPTVAIDSRPIRQLVKARDVAKKLGVSISWVIQHASGKRKPYLPAVKMGPGRSPLRFDPVTSSNSLTNAGVLRDNAQDTPEGEWSVASARLRHGQQWGWRLI